MRPRRESAVCPIAWRHTCYLSDQLLLFGRLWHGSDLLEQFLEGGFGVILSVGRAAIDAAVLLFDCLRGGRGRWGRDSWQGSSSLPRAENQIILRNGGDNKSVFLL